MVERFKASVLKTDEGQPSGGSNPPLSAIFIFKKCGFLSVPRFRFFLFGKEPASFPSGGLSVIEETKKPGSEAEPGECQYPLRVSLLIAAIF